ncbi:hypothetical protein ACP70R_031150 [Stipagrostis hirtigluma subsp. patula]
MPSTGAPPPTVTLFVDRARKRVLFAEAGADAVAFLDSLLATPVADAAGMLLREDPAFAAAGCFGNLSAAAAAGDRALLRGASSSSSLAPLASPASAASSRARAGMGMMARKLFRCGHLDCRCSDVVSRVEGSPCPCTSCGGGAGRTAEVHYLEPSFYRRLDGSTPAAAACRAGAGRTGDTFYRCHARDERHGGRPVFPCRYRVTDEPGLVCPLCRGKTTVKVRCAKGEGDQGSRTRPEATAGALAPALRYAITDDLSVRPMDAGLSRAALLAALGVDDDPAAVREKTVRLGYKEGLGLLWASLRSKTALTDVFLRAAAATPATPPLAVAADPQH